MTEKQIKSDRLKFKFGSFEWLVHYGLSTGFFVLGLIGFYFIPKDPFAINKTFNFDFIYSATCLTLGILIYWIQDKKLVYKTINLSTPQDKEVTRKTITDILNTHSWTIEANNKKYLIASLTRRLCDEQILIFFRTDKISWTAINHTRNHNSFASLFCPLTKTAIILDEIEKASA